MGSVIEVHRQLIPKLSEEAARKLQSVIKKSGGLDLCKDLILHENLHVHLQTLDVITQVFPSNDDEVLRLNIMNRFKIIIEF